MWHFDLWLVSGRPKLSIAPRGRFRRRKKSETWSRCCSWWKTESIKTTTQVPQINPALPPLSDGEQWLTTFQGKVLKFYCKDSQTFSWVWILVFSDIFSSILDSGLFLMVPSFLKHYTFLEAIKDQDESCTNCCQVLPCLWPLPRRIGNAGKCDNDDVICSKIVCRKKGNFCPMFNLWSNSSSLRKKNNVTAILRDFCFAILPSTDPQSWFTSALISSLMSSFWSDRSTVWIQIVVTIETMWFHRPDNMEDSPEVTWPPLGEEVEHPGPPSGPVDAFVMVILISIPITILVSLAEIKRLLFCLLRFCAPKTDPLKLGSHGGKMPRDAWAGRFSCDYGSFTVVISSLAPLSNNIDLTRRWNSW